APTGPARGPPPAAPPPRGPAAAAAPAPAGAAAAATAGGTAGAAATAWTAATAAWTARATAAWTARATAAWTSHVHTPAARTTVIHPSASTPAGGSPAAGAPTAAVPTAGRPTLCPAATSAWGWLRAGHGTSDRQPGHGGARTGHPQRHLLPPRGARGVLHRQCCPSPYPDVWSNRGRGRDGYRRNDPGDLWDDLSRLG